jgi:hypothetical protein
MAVGFDEWAVITMTAPMAIIARALFFGFVIIPPPSPW